MDGQYHRIKIEDINPFAGQQLAATAYLLGSLGSGKTRFMKRLEYDTNGKLVIESGIFDLFQMHVAEFVQRKRASGHTGPLTDFFIIDRDFSEPKLDPDFTLPDIDGLNLGYCFQSSIPLDKTLEEVADDNPFTMGGGQEAICRNMPYSGPGAYHYREALSKRIRSGGKSGYPDWLFIPRAGGRYAQMISFPGHHRIGDFADNQSIPLIPKPDSAIYLVDPDIGAFGKDGDGNEQKNEALAQCHLSLADALELEDNGVPVHWFLSKTEQYDLFDSRLKAKMIYSSSEDPKLREIGRRAEILDGFDSIKSFRKDLARVLEISLPRVSKGR